MTNHHLSRVSDRRSVLRVLKRDKVNNMKNIARLSASVGGQHSDAHMDWPVSELSRAHRAGLLRHFLELDVHDRRLRFGAAPSDTAVRAYVARIDFQRDAVFGVFDEELRIIGAAHLARASEQAELGISVLQDYRNRGVGGALLMRTVLRARNWGVRALYMHCLRENETMMHLARTQGMRIVTEQGETNAWLGLPPADATSHFSEVFAQRVALFDYALKSQLAGARRLVAGLSFSQASNK
jgi:GNAT superfamily N-acetyltransferase